MAHPHRQFHKLGNGCILVINFFNKHSIVKMYLVKVVSLSGFHLKYLIKSLIFKIFFLLGLVKARPKQAQSMPVRFDYKRLNRLCVYSALAEQQASSGSTWLKMLQSCCVSRGPDICQSPWCEAVRPNNSNPNIHSCQKLVVATTHPMKYLPTENGKPSK